MECCNCYGIDRPFYIFTEIKISGTNCLEFAKIVGKPVCCKCKEEIMQRLNYYFRFAYLSIHMTKMDPDLY